MKENIDELEKKLKESFPKEDTIIHRLATEKDELLVVSQKKENNSFSFYTPKITKSYTDGTQVTLMPIDNIFDFLEENKIVVEIPKEDEEKEMLHERKR